MLWDRIVFVSLGRETSVAGPAISPDRPSAVLLLQAAVPELGQLPLEKAASLRMNIGLSGDVLSVRR